MLEVVFINSFPTAEGEWSYGLLLQQSAANFYHWIRIRHDGAWMHSYRLGSDANVVSLRQEVPPVINTDPQGQNRIRLVVIEDQGWLFINDEVQGILSLGAVSFDRVSLVLSDGIPGASTRFESFAAWNWYPSLASLPQAVSAPAEGTPYEVITVLPAGNCAMRLKSRATGLKCSGGRQRKKTSWWM